MRRMRAECNELVIKEGEVARELYVVVTGAADVFVQWNLPGQMKVGSVSKGALFGEVEMLHQLKLTRQAQRDQAAGECNGIFY